jgi:hypothetical protein
MRLIDADALIEGRVENDPVRIAAACAPIAYDVEAVVEKLDKERKEYEQSWGEYDTEDDFGGMCAMGRAIDIVRSGGKE